MDEVEKKTNLSRKLIVMTVNSLSVYKHKNPSLSPDYTF